MTDVTVDRLIIGFRIHDMFRTSFWHSLIKGSTLWLTTLGILRDTILSNRYARKQTNKESNKGPENNPEPSNNDKYHEYDGGDTVKLAKG